MSTNDSNLLPQQGRRAFLKTSPAIAMGLIMCAALKADDLGTLASVPSSPPTHRAALSPQRLCADIDFSHAILINLPPNSDLLIQYYFLQTIHQNLLALSLLGETGSFSHYLLAQWRDTTQAYTLSNNSEKRQIWYLSGWDVANLLTR